MQNYSAENAYKRWQGELGQHLSETRRVFKARPILGIPDAAFWEDGVMPNPVVRFVSYNLGRVVWGVFVRAFWPIYMQGKNNHNGTVILGFDEFFEDSPALYEIAQDVRALRDIGGEPNHLRKFAAQIRDDYHTPLHRIQIPNVLSGGRKAYFQSVFIPRGRLPGGCLHHRLVPVVAHPRSSYASILALKYWPDEFKRKWLLGDPLLNQAELAGFQAAFPAVEP